MIEKHKQRKCGDGISCKAPFNNMYFNVTGSVAPCWLSIGHIENWNENKNINDIWFGDKFNKLRNSLSKDIFLEETKCSVCENKIKHDNLPLAVAYDNFSIKKYPTLLEIELSNKCNYECMMCNETLSSSIRRNKAKLPPLPEIYDDNFIEQLREFLPHLEEIRFNGGEPLLHEAMYKICEIIAEVNRDCCVSIATNGSVFNTKVKKLCERNRVHFNVSLDGITPETYEKIRKNGRLDRVLKNISIFKDYENTLYNEKVSIMVNPMNNNWWEIGEIVHYCINEDHNLWFNTIHHPKNLSLWDLPKIELEKIYNSMKEELIFFQNCYPNDSRMTLFTHLVEKQIKTWLTKETDNYI